MDVEWLILADGAQTMGNKLYLLGGGWDAVTVSGAFPISHHMAIAVSFRVPWAETNVKHNFEVGIEHEDGESLATIGGQFEVGRPVGIPAGSDQRSQVALDMSLELPKPGVYAILVKLEGEDSARTHFRVVPQG